MSNNVGKNKVVANHVPLLSFSARGTLFHEQPDFATWALQYLRQLGAEVSDEAFEQAYLSTLAEFNQKSEKQEFEDQGLRHPEWTVDILVRKLISNSEKHEPLSQHMKDQFLFQSKLVMPQSTIEACETLGSRGYRLAIVTNESNQLIELLKMYQLLDLFELVLTAEDVGAFKPAPRIFDALLEDTGLEASQWMHFGGSYARDIQPVKRKGGHATLYDPRQMELKALSKTPVDRSQKVVSIDSIRSEKELEGVRVIDKFEEILSVCE